MELVPNEEPTTHQIAQYILSLPGYAGYEHREKQRLLAKLGPSVLPAVVEYPDDPEAA
jgi:hypothetical protein